MLKILFAVFRSGLGFGLGIEFVGNFVMDSDNAYHLIRGREWRSLLYSDTLQYNLGVLLSNLIPELDPVWPYLLSPVALLLSGVDISGSLQPSLKWARSQETL